jgi:hypothetical protein
MIARGSSGAGAAASGAASSKQQESRTHRIERSFPQTKTMDLSGQICNAACMSCNAREGAKP